MIRDREITCSAVQRNDTGAAEQVQNMTFWMCWKMNMLLQAKTIQAGYRICCETTVNIVHMYIEIPH